MAVILTGDRPTGNLHLGHYAGTLKRRVELQREHETYLLIADVQALTSHAEHPDLIRENVHNVLASYIAAGIDTERVSVCVQSQIPEIHELYVYFSNLVTVAQLQQNPTIKTELRLGYAKGVPLGFLGYPVHQASDIAVFRADLVPVGQDQLPHIEECRDVVRKFNALYGETLVEPKALVGEVPTLPGIDGKEKMSKSLGNAIFLADEDDALKQKLQKALTDPARVHLTDPGHPEVCVVYKYYESFFRGDVEDVRKKCTGAEWGCGHCKKRMLERLSEFLGPMRDRYRRAKADPGELNRILREGSRRGRERAAATMDAVRKAMHVQPF